MQVVGSPDPSGLSLSAIYTHATKVLEEIALWALDSILVDTGTQASGR